MRHQQLTDELQERALLYAAGALDEPERTEYSRHLQEDDCAVCKAEVLESEAAAQSLAMMLPLQTPSESVKQRLLDQAEAARGAERPRPAVERRRPALAWGGWLVAAAALVLAAVFLNLNTGLRQEVQSLNARVVELESQITAQEIKLASFTSTQTKVVTLVGLNSTTQASGRIFRDEAARIWRFYVENLPPAPANRAYQLWAVPDGNNAVPVSAGVFNTDASGAAMLELQAPMVAGVIKLAAVTEEPAQGSPGPTTMAFNLLGPVQ
jgi:anti-sigma-K factor RskA